MRAVVEFNVLGWLSCAEVRVKEAWSDGVPLVR